MSDNRFIGEFIWKWNFNPILMQVKAIFILKDASGSSIGAVLASNKVNSSASAYIENDGILNDPLDPDIDVGGTVTVKAMDTASIVADTQLKAVSTVTNDFGASALADLADSLISDYQYTTESGEQYVDPAQKVRVGAGHGGGGRAGSIFIYSGKW